MTEHTAPLKVNFASYLASSFCLTFKHYGKLLPYYLIVSLVYTALSFTYHFINFESQPQLLSILMIGWLLWVPLIAGYLYFHSEIMKDNKPNFKHAFLLGFSKILALISSLVGIFIVPSLLIGLSSVLAFFLIHRELEQALWPVVGVTCFLIILLLNTNLLSLLIICTASSEATFPGLHLKEIMKGHYFQTLSRSTLAFLLLCTLFTTPFWLNYVVELTPELRWMALAGNCLCVLLISPFFWNLMIMDLHYLERNKIQHEPKPETKVRKAVQAAPKAQLKDEDWF